MPLHFLVATPRKKPLSARPRSRRVLRRYTAKVVHGRTSEDIATTLNSVLEGSPITQVRDSIYLVNVTGRATAPERASIDTLRGKVPFHTLVRDGWQAGRALFF